MVTERLLQYIWQLQYYNCSRLATVQGEMVQVQAPGQLNTNQGPDFLNARLRLGGTAWAGHIELHLKTSDWLRHRHQEDINYRNVILHVVWEHDAVVNDVPVVELKGRVSGLLLARYEELMAIRSFIPCQHSIGRIEGLKWENWKARLVAERLTRKARKLEEFLQQNKSHWEEAFWWLLARNFGMRVNADAFEQIARSVPLSLLRRESSEFHRVEALLMGQAGLLEKKRSDEYARSLQKEYRFQQHKYGLRPAAIPVQFLRMRPGNFPTVRLAQLAALLASRPCTFGHILQVSTVEELRELLNVQAGAYWDNHYRFDEESVALPKKIGRALADGIIINSIMPALFAYGNYTGEQSYRDRVLEWLTVLRPEYNTVVQGFESIGVQVTNALDSQALLELKGNYCDQQLCLKCTVGNMLLRGNDDPGKKGSEKEPAAAEKSQAAGDG